MNLTGGRERLARSAVRLKKAWILSVAMVGLRNLQPQVSAEQLVIPDYSSWSRPKLQDQVLALEADLGEVLAIRVQLATGKKTIYRVAEWLERHYDHWQEAGRGMYRIANVLDFEHHVGPIRSKRQLDPPPYGEMLLPGFLGLAIRHPAYMLVRDVGLLFDLHFDVDRLLQGATLSDASWAVAAGKNQQSLARSVILSCFNLLESFANGLAREWLRLHPAADAKERAHFEETQKPLRTRLLSIVKTASGGHCSLDVNKPPISELFGPIKNRRDAIVHSEPGSGVSSRG
jgi:hypothetical protein